MITLIFVLLVALPEFVDGRGKKKKKSAPSTGGSGVTCDSLGLDCSATCCLVDVCADTKFSCAQTVKRPYSELYYGFITIIVITVGLSLLIGVINFCLMYKFFQHYDENLDSMVGGVSICDIISCLLTCGLIYRKKENQAGPSAEDLDFRRRFEKSMDKQNGGGEIIFGETKKKVREKKIRSVANYLSQNAKMKLEQGSMVRGDDIDGLYETGMGNQKRNKCHEFCCIVFCCIDANIYYGEERYQKIIMLKEIEKQRLVEEEEERERARRMNSEFNTPQNQLLNDNQEEDFE